MPENRLLKCVCCCCCCDPAGYQTSEKTSWARRLVKGRARGRRTKPLLHRRPMQTAAVGHTHTHTTRYENRAAAATTTSESWPDVPGGSAPCLITAASLQHSRGAQHRACRLGYTSTFYFLFVFFVFVLFLCSAAAAVVVLGVQMGKV